VEAISISDNVRVEQELHTLLVQRSMFIVKRDYLV